MMREYSLQDLVRVAKRENNTKRPYLYVNPLQGKHIPVRPLDAMDLFGRMKEIMEETHLDERLLVIGFAETATGIGSAVATSAKNADYYLNTTREDIPGAEYLFFTESHSHAAEQRLVKNGLEKAVKNVDLIVFVEDEVTTGNTIEKLIREIEKTYGPGLHYGILSILNSMTDERKKELKEKGIDCSYVCRLPHEYHIDGLDAYSYCTGEKRADGTINLEWKEIRIGGYWNCRMTEKTGRLKGKVDVFVKNAIRKAGIRNGADILVLGTEEFMFPAMAFGAKIKETDPEASVHFHATTRSPIEVSTDAGYPLHNRCVFDSQYEVGRRTYLYNLRKYDQVFIVTDAAKVNEAGLKSLIRALAEYGNDDITLIRWEEGTA